MYRFLCRYMSFIFLGIYIVVELFGSYDNSV